MVYSVLKGKWVCSTFFVLVGLGCVGVKWLYLLWLFGLKGKTEAFFSPSGMGEDKVCDKSYLRKHFWFSFSVCFSGRCDSPSCHLFILKLEPCPSTGFHWHVVLLLKCSSPDVGITCFSLNYTDYLVQIDLIGIWWLWEDSQRENILRQNWLMSNIWTILTSCCGHITLWVW